MPSSSSRSGQSTRQTSGSANSRANGRANGRTSVARTEAQTGEGSEGADDDDDGEEEDDAQEASENEDSGRGTQKRRRTIRGATAASQNMRYEPHGDPDKKRETRRGYRKLIESVREARNNIAEQRPDAITQYLRESSRLYGEVEAPAEGVLDARVLSNAAEMGAAIAKEMKVGSKFDLEEYITRCAQLIGGRLKKPNRIDVDLDDEDDPANDPALWRWDRLGRRAVMRSRRAVTMDHLLGPLEITHTKRVMKARTSEKVAAAVKPVEMKEGDMVSAQNETSVLVRKISKRLEEIGGNVGVNFFRFVLDPHSFSNSVENLFYVSFLIREGTASLSTDAEDSGEPDGEPVLMSCEPPEEADFLNGLARRQIVLELDMQVWKELCEAYDIREPMIEPRDILQTAQTDTWSATPARS